ILIAAHNYFSILANASFSWQQEFGGTAWGGLDLKQRNSLALLSRKKALILVHVDTVAVHQILQKKKLVIMKGLNWTE
ncbi:hypothetical protein KC19_2G277000, partial [Ceratodon purpureus]